MAPKVHAGADENDHTGIGLWSATCMPDL